MIQQFDALIQADSATDLIAGFDLKDEEDYCPAIDNHLEMLYELKLKHRDKF